MTTSWIKLSNRGDSDTDRAQVASDDGDNELVVDREAQTGNGAMLVLFHRIERADNLDCAAVRDTMLLDDEINEG